MSTQITAAEIQIAKIRKDSLWLLLQSISLAVISNASSVN
jgi:hypothetical protein